MTNRLNIDVKICGLRDRLSMDAAINNGANHLGFIFFEKSPRNVTPQLAAQLIAPIRGKVTTVAVSVNADNDFLDDIVATMTPDMLQLHGSETPQRVAQVQARFNLPVMKAFAIRQASDFDKVEDYFPVADRLLFDAKPPAGSELPGGNGIAFDWALFARWQDANKHRFEHPAMLSGGINPDNICDALGSSNARAIDISSGVENSPGVKDPALIEVFLKQVKEFENAREKA
ncbi:MAG: phosphoribosylanthranilate isomerase [Rhizobiaceae bacterium]|nr:phosphoribosylanthranilate isomerase [Rhizobiaceae bacterium]